MFHRVNPTSHSVVLSKTKVSEYLTTAVIKQKQLLLTNLLPCCKFGFGSLKVTVVQGVPKIQVYLEAL